MTTMAILVTTCILAYPVVGGVLILIDWMKR